MALTEVAPLPAPELAPAPSRAVTVVDRPRRLDAPRDAFERAWGHYHDYHRPLKSTLTEILGDRPRRLDIATDRSAALVGLPVTFTGEDKKCEAVVRAVTAKLAHADLQPAWHLHGRDPHVTFTRVHPPPPMVTLDTLASDDLTVLEHIQANKWHELLWGLGQRDAIVQTSIDTESPHTGLSQPSGAGKALALDTRVPTPSGWTTMGEIGAGDVVYDETGAPCKVTHAWHVRHGRPCYEVEFSDGSVIVADAEHQWVAETFAARSLASNRRRNKTRYRNSCGQTAAEQYFQPVPEVVTTEVMAGKVRDGKHSNYAVRIAAPLQCPDADLPVAPYTLGAWLGDGHSYSSWITSADPEIIAEIEAEGQPVRVVPSTVRERHANYCVPGLITRLKAIGIYGGTSRCVRAKKHIPAAYMRASQDQRRALLAGLLDTDGCCDTRGRVEFYSTQETLARDVYHLVATLGYKVTIGSRTARLYGKDCGTAWIVRFTPSDKVFRLPRKVSRQAVSTRRTSGYRYVTAVRPVPSVPVRCIAVDSPSHLYLVGDACIPTHNSIDARSSLAQLLHHGALGIVLDVKLFSHRWAQGLPNVAYCKTPAQIHNMLMWLAGDEDGRVSEIARRNQVADAGADIEGRVHANVGPPIVVICEELNTTQRMIDRYYKKELRQRGDPARSPASDALDIGLFIGGQVKVFYYLICQRGSVKAVSGAGGGGDARDNIGVWAMCDPSPATFRMIGWDHDLPPAAGHVGRKQIVTAQWVKESQNLYMTGAEARRLAVSGTRAAPRDDMPYIGDVVNVPSDYESPIEAGQENGHGEMRRPPPPPGITVDEAVAAGIFGDRKAAAVKKQILRDSNAPQPVRPGYRGGPAHRYDEDALRAFAAREMG